MMGLEFMLSRVFSQRIAVAAAHWAGWHHTAYKRDHAGSLGLTAPPPRG